MRLKNYLALLVAVALTAPCHAAIVGFDFTPVDNTAGGAALAGFTTTDLSVSGSGQLTGVQLLLNLTEGSIYQDAFGQANNTAPSAAFIGLAPSLAFDTFVGLGGTTDVSSLAPVIPGGAVNLGGDAAVTFDTAKLDITYAPPGADPVFNPADYFVGRISLSSDAAGTALVLGASFQEDDYVSEELQIVDGQIVVGNNDPLLEAMVLNSGDLSDDLQGAFNGRAGGDAILPEAIMVMNGNGELDALGTITATVDRTDAFGSEISLDAIVNQTTGKIDLVLAGQFDAVLPGTLITGDVVIDGANSPDAPLRLGFSVSVPEPSTFALAGLALVGLVGFTRRK